MNERKSLADIIHGSAREQLESAWKNTKAAPGFGPIPLGEYLCRCLKGELFTSSVKGTLGYKLTLEVVEGEYARRRVWHDVWLAGDAMARAKYDLAQLGVTDLGQLERPLPPGILVRARVRLCNKEGRPPYNEVTRLTAAGVEPGDAFEPGCGPDGEPLDTSFDVGGFDPPAPPEAPAPTQAELPLDGPAPGPYGEGR